MLEKFIPTAKSKASGIIKETFYSFNDNEIETEWKKESLYYDIPRIGRDDLKKVLVELAPKYNEAWTEEM